MQTQPQKPRLLDSPTTLELRDQFCRAREALRLELKREGLNDEQAHKVIMQHQERGYKHYMSMLRFAENLKK